MNDLSQVMNYALCLDDDPKFLRIIERMAEQIGYLAQGSTDAEDFKWYYRQSCPWVVVLDVMLGTNAVFDVIKFLGERQFPGGVIFVSGFDHNFLQAAEESARKQNLRVLGSVQKGRGIGKLTILLSSTFIGALPSPEFSSIAELAPPRDARPNCLLTLYSDSG